MQHEATFFGLLNAEGDEGFPSFSPFPLQQPSALSIIHPSLKAQVSLLLLLFF